MYLFVTPTHYPTSLVFTPSKSIITRKCSFFNVPFVFKSLSCRGEITHLPHADTTTEIIKHQSAELCFCHLCHSIRFITIILKCFPDFLHIQHLKVPRQFYQLCLQTKQIYCCSKKIQYHIYGDCNRNGLGRDFKL